MFKCQITIRKSLRLNSLARVHNQNRAFTGCQRPRNFISKIHVSGSINKIHLIILSLKFPIHSNRLKFNRDSPFLLQFHCIQHLPMLHLTFRKRPSNLQKSVRKSGFSVINVRDDAKISYVFHSRKRIARLAD